MIDLDELAPQYRLATQRWPDARMLAAHFDTLADTYKNKGQGLVECIKSFVECVCRTILGEFGHSGSGDAETTRLVTDALDRLGIRNSRGASKFDKILSGYNRLSDALSEFRNHEGPIAHGKDGFLEALEAHHLRAYVLAGDTLLSMLLAAHDGTEPDLNYTREPYERFARNNERIDAVVAVEATLDDDDGTLLLRFRTPAEPDGFELRTRPSQLLYLLDRAAYVEVLKTAPVVQASSQEDDAPLVESLPEGPAPVPAQSAVSHGSKSHRKKHYTGRFDYLVLEIGAFLEQILGDRARAKEIAPQILRAFEEQAGLDWSARENLRAAVRVAFKRTLRAHDVDGHGGSLPDKLVEWFAGRVPTVDRHSGGKP